MKLSTAITKRIYQLCDRNHITPNKLAVWAGLPAGTLKSIFYGKSKNTGTRTLLNLCQALEITLCDFFTDPLFQNHDLEEDD